MYELKILPLNLLILNLIVKFKGTQGFSHMGKEFYITLPQHDITPSLMKEAEICIYTKVKPNITVVMTMIQLDSAVILISRDISVVSRAVTTQRLHVQSSYFLGETGSTISLKFSSSGEFSLSLMFFISTYHVAAYQALPTHSWGKEYYVITTSNKPVIRCLSSEEKTTLQIFPLAFNESSSELLTRRWTLPVGGKLHSVHNCNQTNTTSVPFGLTGTLVHSSKPIGVISSNCVENNYNDLCVAALESAELNSDVLAEMLWPAKAYGDHFLSIIATADARAEGRLLLQASRNRTIVHISKGGRRGVEVYEINQPGEFILVHSLPGARVIRSNKDIQVLYFLSYTCRPNSAFPPDLSVTTLVPTKFFYKEYAWSCPEIDGYIHFVIILMQRPFINQLTINGIVMQLIWTKVIGSYSWHIAEKQLKKHSYVASTTQETAFGFYAYGMGHNSGYMLSPGFDDSSPCQRSATSLSDQCDNDCDFEIDEELLNNVDDDNDNLVDEDLGTYEMTSKMPLTEDIAECRPFTWGEYCSRSCSNCVDNCRSKDGICTACRPGFMNPSKSCADECPEYFYGLNCAFSCFMKCGADCVDRRDGKCPALYTYLHYYLLLALTCSLLAGAVTFGFSKNRERQARQQYPRNTNYTSYPYCYDQVEEIKVEPKGEVEPTLIEEPDINSMESTPSTFV